MSLSEWHVTCDVSRGGCGQAGRESSAVHGRVAREESAQRKGCTTISVSVRRIFTGAMCILNSKFANREQSPVQSPVRLQPSGIRLVRAPRSTSHT